MLFKNALLFRDDFTFSRGDFAVEDEHFTSHNAGQTVVDLEGKIVVPGFIDIHTHGNSGFDFSDGSYSGLVKIARFIAHRGITSFAATSMTLPEKEISSAINTALRLRDERPEDAATLRGITMEGPFFNVQKKGAQNEAYLQDPDFDFFLRLFRQANGLIRIACVAPELPGALPFIEKTAELCTVAVAHTAATYEEAKAGFAAGIRHVTHLFNAMPPFAHRQPGVIGAAAEDDKVTAELITDGIHVHPSAIRAAFKLFGPARLVLISDAISACGMPDGNYHLGGQQVSVSGRLVTLADGTIAGAATNLFDSFRTCLECGIRPEDALRAVTANPARVLGVYDQVGSISSGKQADFIVCNHDWTIDAVYLRGRRIYQEDI